MRLIPYDVKKVNAVGFKVSNNYKTLLEFAKSKMECAKVEDYTQANASGCAASLNASIKRFHLDGIRAISRKGNVYLIRVHNE